MPIRNRRPRRRSRRLCALVTISAALGSAALALPSSAGAYTDHFCQFTALAPGWECFAPNPHTLQQVNGWTIGSTQRICAASFTAPWGTQNSDWRCDYGATVKFLGGRVGGVGALHNGDPGWLTAYGTQDF
jgi:hypothetical protein